MIFALSAYNRISHPSCSSEMNLPFLHQQMGSNSSPLQLDWHQWPTWTWECGRSNILGLPSREHLRLSHFVLVSYDVFCWNSALMLWETQALERQRAVNVCWTASIDCHLGCPAPMGLQMPVAPANIWLASSWDPRKSGPTEPSQRTTHDRE